eukprot:9384344-Pyramimonas_sp.AAC.1
MSSLNELSLTLTGHVRFTGPQPTMESMSDILATCILPGKKYLLRPVGVLIFGPTVHGKRSKEKL